MSRNYFILQLKRAAKIFPSLLISSLILLLSLGFLAVLIFFMDDSEERNQKITIGMVGEARDSYLGIGMGIMKNMDASRFSIAFLQMEEEEARRKLRSGEIAGYVLVPEEFIEALGRGENIPLTYVSTGAGGALSDQIIKEISDIISVTIMNSEKAIYAMQEYMLDHELESRMGEVTDRMNLRIIDMTLNRNRGYKIQRLEAFQKTPIAVYYFCGILIFFLLIWGINASLLLLKKDSALYRLLNAGGCNAFFQVSAEYGAFFIMLFGLLLFLILMLRGLGTMLWGDLEQWGFSIGTGRLILFLLPVILLIAALHFLLYEWIEGLIPAVLFEFILSVGLAYISGCFYPIAFFPEAVQKLSSMLPTGAGMLYLLDGIRFGEGGGGIAPLLLYTLLFLGCSMLLRERRIRASS